MSYKCYLFGEQMPETPGKLTLKVKGTNKTVTLLNEGEINFLKLPGLTDITLPLTFPMFGGKHRPDYYLNLLEKAKTGRTTTQFIMTRSTPGGILLFDTNIKVSVEDYNIEENAENGLDLAVEVKLKQYRDYGTKTVTIKTETAHSDTKTATTGSTSGSTSGSTKPAATTSKIVAGDKVMITSGAVYGGLYAKTRGVKVPSAYIGKWYTVQQVAKHNGEDEALIKELYSWVAFKYLQKQGATTTSAKTATVTTERSATTAPKATTYTVKKGDTLWGIAKTYLGNGAKYTQIYEANKSIIKNPNLVYVGQVLTIPK